MSRRIGYDPMMCPQQYHTWSQKLHEHGFEEAVMRQGGKKNGDR